MTETILSQVKAAEMGFMRRVHGLTLRWYVGSCEIHQIMITEPPIIRIERSQLRWFGHVCTMPQEILARHVLLAASTGKRPVCRPRTRWSDYISELAGLVMVWTQQNNLILLLIVRYFGFC